MGREVGAQGGKTESEASLSYIVRPCLTKEIMGEGEGWRGSWTWPLHVVGDGPELIFLPVRDQGEEPGEELGGGPSEGPG